MIIIVDASQTSLCRTPVTERTTHILLLRSQWVWKWRRKLSAWFSRLRCVPPRVSGTVLSMLLIAAKFSAVRGLIWTISSTQKIPLLLLISLSLSLVSVVVIASAQAPCSHVAVSELRRLGGQLQPPVVARRRSMAPRSQDVRICETLFCRCQLGRRSVIKVCSASWKQICRYFVNPNHSADCAKSQYFRFTLWLKAPRKNSFFQKLN